MKYNTNGLLKDKNELQAILSTENINICLTSETNFTNESHIKLRNCVIYEYHAIHPCKKAQCGNAIIIRDNIKHYEEEKFATQYI